VCVCVHCVHCGRHKRHSTTEGFRTPKLWTYTLIIALTHAHAGSLYYMAWYTYEHIMCKTILFSWYGLYQCSFARGIINKGDGVAERTEASVVTHTGAGSNLGSRVPFFFGQVTVYGTKCRPGMADTHGCQLKTKIHVFTNLQFLQTKIKIK